jgi:hypothetical protein
MHPTEIIEFMIVGFIIAVTVIISLFSKGKWRKFGWSLALLFLVVYCIYYFVRPYWIDMQINKNVELLEPYLEQHYPNEEWVISTVPHREGVFKHSNPYYIGVVFESEPEVTYHYWIENKNDIYQIGYSTDKWLDELEHMENEIK